MTGGYCKLSDAKINAIKALSTNTDPYIIHSFKNYGHFFGVNSPDCTGYVQKSCTWTLGDWAGGCSNAKTRGETRCSVDQQTESYRGVDGHRCNNIGPVAGLFSI